jgi:eukaryotic-like serine/threonine-protein kinase
MHPRHILLVLPTLFAATTLQAGSQFRCTPDGRGAEEAIGPDRLEMRWTCKTDGYVLSSPVAAEGLALFGSQDNQLRAVETRSGRVVWTYPTGGDIASAPAVANGIAVVLSRDGKCHGVEVQTGKPLWTFETNGESRYTRAGVCYTQPFTETVPDPWDLFLSSPVIAEGLVYFGSGDHHLYALDLLTGALRWKYKTGDVVHASPAVADGRLYCGSFDTRFYCLDAASGEKIWEFKTGSDDSHHLMEGIVGGATIANGAVYFGARDARFYCLEQTTGILRWSYEVKGTWVVASPAYANGRVYFCTSDTHLLIGLDAHTGTEVMRASFKGYGYSSPLIAGKRIYVGSFAGECTAFDLSTGQPIANFSTPGQKQNGDDIFDQSGAVRAQVYAGCETLDDTIVAIRSRLFSVGGMLSSPTLTDGMILIGSTDGNLYALGAP